MAGNQTQIPIIQHDDKDVVQIQQNVNKVLRNLNNQSQANQGLAIIGEVRSAFLTEEQFQKQAGENWLLCDGQDCEGSQYESITGNKTVPDMRATVPRMKDNGRGLNPLGEFALGAYQPDVVGPHTHKFNYSGNVEDTVLCDGAANTGAFNRMVNGGSGNFGNLTITSTGTGIGYETAAKSTTINFFIRID